MTHLKKLGALLLVLVLVMSISVPAFAEVGLTNGEVGGYTTADTPTVNDKVVKIEKEITVFNPDEPLVYGPAITYTYTITPAENSELKTITDETSTANTDVPDHYSGLAVTVTAQAGITTNVVVNGGTVGNATSASGTLAWTNADILDASSSGAANKKTFTVDFSNVVFTEPGVYRYKITETAATYVTSGVIDGNGNTANVRYLDVYVMRSNAYDPATITKDDWRVYGYVCTETASDNINPSTTKTNGFVNSAASGTNADNYHTYNLTVGKTLSGDTTMNSHPFPFDVAWTAGDATGTFQFAVKPISVSNSTITKGAALSGSTLMNTPITADTYYPVGSADAVGTVGKDGNPAIANGEKFEYVGIPCTTKYTVTETNDVTGTTYSTTAVETIDSTDTDVVWTGGTADKSGDNKTATMDPSDTTIYPKSTAPAADKSAAVQVTNTLAIISPTGVMFRVAPYALMLAAGIVLFALSRKRKAEEEA